MWPAVGWGQTGGRILGAVRGLLPAGARREGAVYLCHSSTGNALAPLPLRLQVSCNSLRVSIRVDMCTSARTDMHISIVQTSCASDCASRPAAIAAARARTVGGMWVDNRADMCMDMYMGMCMCIV